MSAVVLGVGLSAFIGVFFYVLFDTVSKDWFREQHRKQTKEYIKLVLSNIEEN